MKASEKKQLLSRYIECCIRLNCDYSHVLGKPLSDIDFKAVEQFIERHIIEPETTDMRSLMLYQTFRFNDSVTNYEYLGPDAERSGWYLALNKTTGNKERFHSSIGVIPGLGI